MASLAAITEPAASAVPGGMHAAWLRGNCPCALCRDPVSGQRLLPIADIPADIAVAEVIASPGPSTARSPTSSAGRRRC
jgi:gamma-butyrobetaine dioxygenase